MVASRYRLIVAWDNGPPAFAEATPKEFASRRRGRQLGNEGNEFVGSTEFESPAAPAFARDYGSACLHPRYGAKPGGEETGVKSKGRVAQIAFVVATALCRRVSVR